MNSILNKMKMDGVDEKTIEKFGGKSAKKAKPAADEKQIMPETAKPMNAPTPMAAADTRPDLANRDQTKSLKDFGPHSFKECGAARRC